MTDDSLLITECILHLTHLFYYLKIYTNNYNHNYRVKGYSLLF